MSCSDRAIVTTILALLANALRYPPDDRVVEEQGFHDGLHDVHKIVTPGHVSEFVRKKRNDLLVGESGEESGGEQHDWLDPTDHGRCRDACAIHHAGFGAHAKFVGEFLKAPLPFAREVHARKSTAHPCDLQTTTDETQEQCADA